MIQYFTRWIYPHIVVIIEESHISGVLVSEHLRWSKEHKIRRSHYTYMTMFPPAVNLICEGLVPAHRLPNGYYSSERFYRTVSAKSKCQNHSTCTASRIASENHSCIRSLVKYGRKVQPILINFISNPGMNLGILIMIGSLETEIRLVRSPVLNHDFDAG